MAVKPSNTVNQLRDLIIQTAVLDVSAATANSTALFVDAEHKWQVWQVNFLPVAAYIAAQATSINVGTVLDPDAFVAAESLGVDAIAAGVLSADVTLQSAKKLLLAGEPLIAGHVQAASQTGTGIIVIRLRAVDQTPFSTKRPQVGQASA